MSTIFIRTGCYGNGPKFMKIFFQNPSRYIPLERKFYADQ